MMHFIQINLFSPLFDFFKYALKGLFILNDLVSIYVRVLMGIFMGCLEMILAPGMPFCVKLVAPKCMGDV